MGFFALPPLVGRLGTVSDCSVTVLEIDALSPLLSGCSESSTNTSPAVLASLSLVKSIISKVC